MYCPGKFFTTCYLSVKLGGIKSSSSGATIGTLGGVIPYVIGVGYGVCGFDFFNSSTGDRVFIYLGKLWIMFIYVISTLVIVAGGGSG